MTATTRLFKAAQVGIVADALTALTDGANINAKDTNTGKTALHYAAEFGHVDLVRALLSKDASANACDTWRRTPLHLASSNGHGAIAQELIEHGAAVSHKDDLNFTPLQYAELHQHTKVSAALQAAMQKQESSHSARIRRADNSSLPDH